MVGFLIYSDQEAMNGNFVYDDAATIVRNNDIKPGFCFWCIFFSRVTFPELSDWTQLWLNDIWGERLNTSTSHKSFRPIVQLTYRINYMFAKSVTALS